MTPEALAYYTDLAKRICAVDRLIKTINAQLHPSERLKGGLVSLQVGGHHGFILEPFVLEAFRDAAMDHLKVLEAAFESDAIPTNLKS